MNAARNLSQSIAACVPGDGGQAELLEWTGASFERLQDDSLAHDPGHLPGAAEPPADAETIALALAALDEAPAKPKVVVARRRMSRVPLILMAAAIPVFAIVQWRGSSLRSSLMVQPPVLTAHSSDASPVIAVRQAQRPAAPTAADTTAAQRADEAAALKLARDTAERDAAVVSTQLETERLARAKAEDAAKVAKEELAAKEEQARKATRIEPAPAATAPSVVVPVAPESKPAVPQIETRAAKPAPAKLVKTSTSSKPRKSDIEQGQEFLAQGKLSAARKSFEKAAKSGMPEGALALGNTYDPSSLAKLGLDGSGDPDLARHWYRRAHEIALQHR